MNRRLDKTLFVVRADSVDGWQLIRGDLAASIGPKDKVLLILDRGRLAGPIPSWLSVADPGRNLVELLGDHIAQGDFDFITFLSSGVVGRGHWNEILKDVLGSLPDHSVVVPRSPASDGGQWVYLSEPGQLNQKDFRNQLSRAWEKGYSGFVTREASLSDACLTLKAVDFSYLSKAGAIDGPLSDMPSQWVRMTGLILSSAFAAGGIYVAHASLVYSYGPIYTARAYGDAVPSTESFPLVSASLIVKDEESEIERCLASLQPLVDEIVVYDTGSTDRTVEIAESMGANVVRGFWDDDFGAARNRALAHCRGRWIVWIDADEVAVCDPMEFRRLLGDPAQVSEMLRVRIRNLVGTVISKAVTHTAMRIFRRSEGSFVGAIHERVVRRPDIPGLHPVPASGDCPVLVLDHYGYINETVVGKAKVARNTKLAMKNHSVDTESDAALQEARTCMMAGDFERAIEIARESFDSFTTQFQRLTAVTVIFQALLVLARYDDAEAWVDRLEQIDQGRSKVISYRAQLAQARGQYSSAIELYNMLPDFQIGDDGVEVSRGYHANDLAACYANIGNFRLASTTLLENMRSRGTLEVHIGALVDLMEKAEVGFDQLADAIPTDQAKFYYAQFLQLEPNRADGVLDQIYLTGRLDTNGLVVASILARSLPLDRVLEWSVRLRGAGLSDLCPLLGIAQSPEIDIYARIDAGAIAASAFSDKAAEGVVLSLLGDHLDESLVTRVATFAPHLTSRAS